MDYTTDINIRPFLKHISDSKVALNKGMRDGVTKMTIRLSKRIKNQKLKGQVLNIKTGALRKSIKTNITSDNDGVTGTVSVDTPYAAVHEFGFKGSVKTKMRSNKTNMKLSWKGSRNMNIPQRSYMGSTLEEMVGEIQRGIKKSIKQALTADLESMGGADE